MKDILSLTVMLIGCDAVCINRSGFFSRRTLSCDPEMVSHPAENLRETTRRKSCDSSDQCLIHYHKWYSSVPSGISQQITSTLIITLTVFLHYWTFCPTNICTTQGDSCAYWIHRLDSKDSSFPMFTLSLWTENFSYTEFDCCTILVYFPGVIHCNCFVVAG